MSSTPIGRRDIPSVSSDERPSGPAKQSTSIGSTPTNDTDARTGANRERIAHGLFDRVQYVIGESHCPTLADAAGRAE